MSRKTWFDRPSLSKFFFPSKVTTLLILPLIYPADFTSYIPCVFCPCPPSVPPSSHERHRDLDPVWPWGDICVVQSENRAGCWVGPSDNRGSTHMLPRVTTVPHPHSSSQNPPSVSTDLIGWQQKYITIQLLNRTNDSVLVLY